MVTMLGGGGRSEERGSEARSESRGEQGEQNEEKKGRR